MAREPRDVSDDELLAQLAGHPAFDALAREHRRRMRERVEHLSASILAGGLVEQKEIDRKYGENIGGLALLEAPSRARKRLEEAVKHDE